MRASPIRNLLEARGARFSTISGREIAAGFSSFDTEYAAVRSGVGLTDFSFTNRFRVGEDGLDVFDRYAAGSVANIRFGRILHTMAVDDAGEYTTVKSSGWEAEEIVLMDVVGDFKERAHDAGARVLSGQASPIEYYMHLKLMDPPALANGVGIARWRVKRHLTLQGFNRLDRKLLQRYADFFDIPIEFLTNFKDHVDIE